MLYFSNLTLIWNVARLPSIQFYGYSSRGKWYRMECFWASATIRHVVKTFHSSQDVYRVRVTAFSSPPYTSTSLTHTQHIIGCFAMLSFPCNILCWLYVRWRKIKIQKCTFPGRRMRMQWPRHANRVTQKYT